MKSIMTLIIAAAACAGVPQTVYGLELSCTPGALRSLVSDPGSVTALTITGEVSDADLLFAGSELPSLLSLDLTGCTVEGGVIPKGAFAGTRLTSLSLPAHGAVKVGDFAFSGTMIERLQVPSNVTDLGTGAFAGCPALVSVTVDGAASGGYAFANCPVLAQAELKGVQAVGEGDFADCPALATVTLSDGCTSIGASAFRGAVSLTSFDFGTSLRSVGASAFARSGLTEALMGGCRALTTIGDMAFADCRSLTTFSVSERAGLGKGALMGCSSLTEASMGRSNNVPDYLATGDAALTSLPLPSDASVIGRYAFKGASSVTSVELPEATSSLGDHAMDGMTALRSISAVKVKGVPVLGEGVFEGVDRANVLLAVDETVADDFKSAPVWQDFNIDVTSSSATLTPGASGIRGRFVGQMLEIESGAAQIVLVELFDLDGRILKTVSCRDLKVSVDTSGCGTDLYLIRCTTAEGGVATLKLAR